MQAMLPLPVRMGLAHAHFEAMHPFSDGNGRVGRMLLPLMMVAEGHQPIYLAPQLEKVRDTHYYAALTAADYRLDYAPIVGVVCEAIIAGAEQTAALAGDLATLIDELKGKVGPRRGSAADRLIDLLPGYPVVSAKQVVELLSVSMPAAARGVSQLEEAGVLVEKTGYARNRIFEAPDVLRLVAEDS